MAHVAWKLYSDYAGQILAPNMTCAACTKFTLIIICPS